MQDRKDFLIGEIFVDEPFEGSIFANEKNWNEEEKINFVKWASAGIEYLLSQPCLIAENDKISIRVVFDHNKRMNGENK